MKALEFYKSLAIVFSLLAIVSCEKVIDLELKQTDRRLIVDAVVSNIPNQSLIRLSQSLPLFSEENIPNISDASVILKTSDGEVYSFQETEEGVYTNEGFLGVENTEYQLEINYKDITIKASSMMPKLVLVDSIELVVSSSGFMGNTEVGYSLKVHFTDALTDTNFYRFDIFRNDTLYDGFVVSKDLFYNGISTYQFFMNKKMQTHDVICVQLSSIDKANYDYFLVLSQTGSPFNVSPGNPISNLQGDAIGYFGAYAQDREYLIIPPLVEVP